MVYTLRICKHLQEFEHEIICCFRGNAYEEVLNNEIKCENLINSSDVSYKYLLLKYWKFFRFIRKGSFDLIHYHQGGVGILLLAFLFRKKAIVFHHLHSGNPIGDNRRKNISLIHLFILKYLSTRTYQIAVAKHVYNFYSKKIGQTHNIKLITNCTPFSFRRKEEKKNGIGFIGRFTSEKGFPLIKPIAEKLKVLNSSLKIFLMGEESKNFMQEFDKSGLNVVIILPSFDVAQFYERIDLLLFPSTAPEGMPLVLLEAVSFDVGIIGYTLPGVKEIVGEDYPLLVNSSDEIMEKIDSYYLNEIDLNNMSTIHKNISDKHSEVDMFNSISDNYQQLLN